VDGLRGASPAALSRRGRVGQNAKRDAEGKTAATARPETEWLRVDRPELRIVSDEAWNAGQRPSRGAEVAAAGRESSCARRVAFRENGALKRPFRSRTSGTSRTLLRWTRCSTRVTRPTPMVEGRTCAETRPSYGSPASWRHRSSGQRSSGPGIGCCGVRKRCGWRSPYPPGLATSCPRRFPGKITYLCVESASPETLGQEQVRNEREP
jgi:hypothetical protein